MSLPFFVCDDPRAGVLVGPEAQHAHVKRIAVGEQIMLTDGNGLTTTGHNASGWAALGERRGTTPTTFTTHASVVMRRT